MTNTMESSKGNKTLGFVILISFITLLVVLVVVWTRGDSEQAVALISDTTTTTVVEPPPTTIPEQETTTTTTKASIPDVIAEEIVVMDGSFEPVSPPEIKPPDSVEIDPDIRAGTSQVVMRSSRPIDDAGSREEVTFTYEVDFLGNIIKEAENEFDEEAYKRVFWLPSSYFTVEPVPSPTFEWDGQPGTYPAQVVDILSDGTVGEPRALPNDKAIAFMKSGQYHLSEPIQNLLFRAASSSGECIAKARSSMRSIYMEAVYLGYEQEGTARELIGEVPVQEAIQLYEFSAEGTAEAMLRLEGGVWDEFELVSVSCGGE